MFKILARMIKFLPLTAWLSKMRYPALFKIVGLLMVISWMLPDPIIMLDEIILTVITVALAKWKASRGGDGEMEERKEPVFSKDGAIEGEAQRVG